MINLKTLILTENFRPRLVGIFSNPFYFSRRGLYSRMKKFSTQLSGRVLDIGCGTKPYKDLFKQVTEYIGLEVGTPESKPLADVHYDGKLLPFSDNSFDSVICNQVLEHVFEPDFFLTEINRVMKKGGYLILTVPFVWDEHEQPFDFGRYSSFGLRYILEKNGFQVQAHEKSVSGISSVFQMLNAYVFKVSHTKNAYLNLLAAVFLMSPLTVLGLLLSWVLPSNEDFYLDNFILAKK